MLRHLQGREERLQDEHLVLRRALEVVGAESGKQFDPRVADVVMSIGEAERTRLLVAPVDASAR